MEKVLYILITCLAVYGSVWYIQRLVKPRAREVLDKSLQNMNNFKLGDKCLAYKAGIGMAGDMAIAVDQDGNKLCLVGGKPGELILAEDNLETKIYYCGDLLKSYLLVDDISIKSTVRQSQAGMVLMNNISTSTEDNVKGNKNITAIELEITVNDLQTPVHKISFLEAPKSKKNSPIYQEALETAAKWHGIISELIVKADTVDEQIAQPDGQLKPEGQHRPYSLADELTRLADLVKQGFITREEFESQKTKLLQ